MVTDDDHQHQSFLTQNDLEAAILNLAASSRDLLGLPNQPHLPADCFPSTSFTPVTLSKPPTSLEFLQRLQAGPCPILIEGALDDRPRLQRWRDNEYLRQTMAGRAVKVAVTPDGRADDIKQGPLGDQWVFALPEERLMQFDDLLSSFNSTSSPLTTTPPEIFYLQSQDSNLTQESSLSPLLPDLIPSGCPSSQTSLRWADEAFNCQPEATNLWIGTSSSVSSMHRDHYENLFHVVRGRKIFTLFPPTEGWFLCENEEEPFEIWRHVRKEGGGGEWTWEKEGDSTTPWIPIEPTAAIDSERNRKWGGKRYRQGLKALRVAVEEGMTLYLPAGWYHHVAQEVDEPPDGQTGLCIAINWWYESQAAFSDKWALLEFVKEIGVKARKTRGAETGGGT